jgi:hypothetical protein
VVFGLTATHLVLKCLSILKRGKPLPQIREVLRVDFSTLAASLFHVHISLKDLQSDTSSYNMNYLEVQRSIQGFTNVTRRFFVKAGVKSCVLFVFGFVATSGAEEGGLSPVQFKDLLKQNIHALKVATFDLKGRVTFEPSEELVGTDSSKTVLTSDLYVASKNDDILIEFTYPETSPLKNLRFLNSPEHGIMVQEMADGARGATITPSNEDFHPAAGYSPMFAAYAFLSNSLTGGGAPAWTSSQFAELWPKLWITLVKQFDPGSLQKKGENQYQASFSKPWGGKAVVVFELAEGHLLPVSTRILNQDESLNFDVKIMDYSVNSNLGLLVPKKCRVQLSRAFDNGKMFIPGVVVTEIANVNINSPLSDQVFEFDPASVDTIVDGKTGTIIDVPK